MLVSGDNYNNYLSLTITHENNATDIYSDG